MEAWSRAVEQDTSRVAQLIEASRARQYLDFRAPGNRQAISADVIRRVLVHHGKELDPFGLRLANASITDELDLRAVTVAAPLHFIGCPFAKAVNVEGADLHDLLISDRRGLGARSVNTFPSIVPGLLANGVRIRRDLNLSGTIITGQYRTWASTSKTSAIWLTEASLGGRLLCIGTKIRTSGDRGIQADRTRI